MLIRSRRSISIIPYAARFWNRNSPRRLRPCDLYRNLLLIGSRATPRLEPAGDSVGMRAENPAGVRVYVRSLKKCSLENERDTLGGAIEVGPLTKRDEFGFSYSGLLCSSPASVVADAPASRRRYRRVTFIHTATVPGRRAHEELPTHWRARVRRGGLCSTQFRQQRLSSNSFVSKEKQTSAALCEPDGKVTSEGGLGRATFQ